MGISRLVHKSVYHFCAPMLHTRLTVKKRNEDDQGNRIKILKQIVWSAVQRHSPGLRDEVVPDLDPADEVEWQE
jgi:hypothetical protein